MQIRKCTQSGKTLNLLGIEQWLPIQQAHALIGVPMEFTDVFYLLILLISFVNSSTVLKFTFNLT